jgi:hypothetical protein
MRTTRTRTDRKTDRKVVEAFFTWNSKGWQLLIVVGVFSCLLGLGIATHEFIRNGLGTIAFGLTLIVVGWYRKTKLRRLYAAFKRARNDDFIRVLLRSWARTDLDIETFVDLPTQQHVAHDPSRISDLERLQLEAVTPKALFLVGQQGDTEPRHTRIMNVAGQSVLEYSPILVSILYLTRTELIVYTAHVDVTKGDLLLEQLHRVFLKEITEVTMTFTTERFVREANSTLFTKYEKVMKTTLEEGLFSVNHAIQVAKRNGQLLKFLSSAPQYRRGEQSVLDHSPYEADPFRFVARRISQAIQNANEPAAPPKSAQR